MGNTPSRWSNAGNGVNNKGKMRLTSLPLVLISLNLSEGHCRDPLSRYKQGVRAQVRKSSGRGAALEEHHLPRPRGYNSESEDVHPTEEREDNFLVHTVAWEWMDLGAVDANR